MYTKKERIESTKERIAYHQTEIARFEEIEQSEGLTKRENGLLELLRSDLAYLENLLLIATGRSC